MKKSTIWIVSIIIGVSFLGLLMLQMRYIEQMVKMRKEQFDESVIRSLNYASRNLEQNETFKYLEDIVRNDIGEDSLSDLYIGGVERIVTTKGTDKSVHGNGDKIYSDFEIQTILKRPSATPKVLRVERSKIDDATRAFQNYVKNAYVYHKGILDEVVYSILYTASEKPLEERITFRLFDQDIRNAL